MLDKPPVLLPLLILVLGACLIYTISLYANYSNVKYIRTSMLLLTLFVLIDGLLYSIKPWSYNTYTYYKLIQTDCITQFGSIFIFSAAIVTTLQLWDYLYQDSWAHAKALVCLLLATASTIMVSATNNLLLILITLSLMTLMTYVLITIVRSHKEATKGGMAYLFINSIATIISLTGLILTFTAIKSFNINYISNYVINNPNIGSTAITGLVLLTFGLLVRISILPLRQLAPEIYNNTPHSITTFISIGINGSIILVFLRLIKVTTLLFTIWPPIRNVLAIVIILSLVLSSLALTFKTINIKQTLTYFAVIHINYLLLSLMSNTVNAYIGTILHLISCLVIFMGAFGVISTFELIGNRITFNKINGLGWKRPILGIATSICMLSIAGFPLTAGFYGKLIIFKELITQGCIPLAIVGYLSSIALVYRSLRLPMALFIEKQSPDTNDEIEEQPVTLPILTNVTVTTCALLSLAIGLMPNVILNTTIIEMLKETIINALL